MKNVLCAGGTVCDHRSDQTVSLCRPLARRRAKVRRPPFELIRARNPCVRLRALFDGCRIVADIQTSVSKIPVRSKLVIIWIGYRPVKPMHRSGFFRDSSAAC
jgi:hypothetical protein